MWRGGGQGERALLASCYQTSLELAAEHRCETVAFPLLSSGIYGYPKDQALLVAMETVERFLMDHEDITVYIVVFDRAAYQIGQQLFEDIAAYIDQNYVDQHTGQTRRLIWGDRRYQEVPPMAAAMPAPLLEADSLEQALEELDESFSQALLRLIDQRGMTDAQCYKRANIDRKLFSKIRKNPGYRPSKPTALAFAVALELTLEETGELLRKAGFALSRSSKFDIIVEYFISRGSYNIFTINEALFAFDQSLLGG